MFKGEGKFFMVISQFQDNHCLFTYLEDYKKNPQTAGKQWCRMFLESTKKFFWVTAEPYMALSYFTDFADSKDVVLIRGDFSGHLNKVRFGEHSVLVCRPRTLL